MAQNDTLLYASLGIAAVYLLTRLGKPVQDTGSAIASTVSDTSNALQPWLENIGMIGKLPSLIADKFSDKTLTVQEAEYLSPSVAEVTAQARANASSNRAILDKAAASFDMNKAVRDVSTQKTFSSSSSKSNVLAPLKKVDLYKVNPQQSTTVKPSIFMK